MLKHYFYAIGQELVQSTVPLLWTRVKVKDKDYWKELLIMIKYIQETWDDKLILKIKDITVEDWYADSDFVVHSDMKSYTWGVLAMDKGEKKSMK